MTAFSFTSFLNNNNGGNGGGRNARPASAPQKKFYIDLCERKRVTPKNINAFTFDQLKKEIDELQIMPDPASVNQINKIKELQDEIIAIGGEDYLKPISDDVLNSLTGGREGTASSLIQKLFEMRQNLNIIAPPTDAQLKILVEWYLCPDVPFESFSSEEVYAMKPGANEAESQTVTIEISRGVDLGDGLWRHMTPDEFAEEIRSKMTKKQASKFIDEHRGAFYDWKRTRITQPQIEYIRELELRLANISTPKAVEFALVDGEMQEIRNTSVDYDAEWNPKAYEPMDDLALLQLSYEDASQWIDQLKSEVSRGNRYESMYNEESVNDDKQAIFNENRQALTQFDAKSKELAKLQDLIFSLEAIAGYDASEIHEIVQELLIEDLDGDQINDRKARIKEFFMSTVTADEKKDYTRWKSEMARIYNMCEDVPVALEILAS